jgi:hypothetical protein
MSARMWHPAGTFAPTQLLVDVLRRSAYFKKLDEPRLATLAAPRRPAHAPPHSLVP